MSEIIAIPLEQILPNPDQPRQTPISLDEIQAMADSLKAIGQKTEIKVIALTEEQKAKYAPCLYMIVGGEHRWRGAKLAGFRTINAIVQDITPDDIELDAFMDNQSNPMNWLDTDLFIARRSIRTGLPQRQLATQLKVSQNKVFLALKVANALSSVSITLIRQNLQKSLILGDPQPITKNKDFLITERLTLVLADLDDTEAVEKALKVVCDDLMTEAEAKKLVTWIKAGNLAETYKAALPVSNLKTASQPPKAIKPTTPASTPLHQAHPTQPAKEHTPASQPETSSEMGTAETVAYDALAGVSVIAKIKTKLKKGERPTAAETLLLAGHALWTALHWLGKHGFKLVKWLAKATWKLSKASLKETLKALGPVGRWIRYIFNIAIFCALIWGIWDIREHGVMHPIRLVEAKLFSTKPTPVPTAIPAQVPTVSVPTPQLTVEPTLETAKHKRAAAIESVAPVQTTPTQGLAKAVATPTVQKGPDLLGQVAGQAAPAVAGDMAKKLFGL